MMKNFLNATVILAALATWGCSEDEEKKLPGGRPPMPVALAQYQMDGQTPLPQGEVTGEDRVVIEAQIQADPAGEQVHLVVQAAPPGSSDGVDEIEVQSDRAPGGSTVQVEVPDLKEGEYVWRAWAVDRFGRKSDPIEFVATPEIAFHYDPAAPVRPRQFKRDNVTPLAVGASTDETGAVLKANAKSPDGNMVRAQFEVKPEGTPFDGTDLIMGTLVGSGEESAGASSVTEGPYHWRVRTEDADGSLSAWVQFGGNTGMDFERVPVAGNAPPSVPTVMSQRQSDIATVIPFGGTTYEEKVVLTARVEDADGDPCALETELKPFGAAFDGVGTVTGNFTDSGLDAWAWHPVSALAYRWRARTVDARGAVSAWVTYEDYYGSPGAAAFFATAGPNRPPTSPTSLGQYQLNGYTPYSYGDMILQSGGVLKGTVNDPDVGNGLVLQVEVRPEGTPFRNMPTAASGVVARGMRAEATQKNLVAGTVYLWQARTIDACGATSTWVAFKPAPPPAPAPTPTTGSSGPKDGNCSGSVALASGSGAVIWLAGLFGGLMLLMRRVR